MIVVNGSYDIGLSIIFHVFFNWLSVKVVIVDVVDVLILVIIIFFFCVCK